MIAILVIALVAVVPMLVFQAAFDLVDWLLGLLGQFTNES